MPTLMFQRGARQLAQSLRVLALGTGMLFSVAAAVAADVVGEVEFVRGVAFAQLGAQTPRIMGAGLPLHPGDRLLTSGGASVTSGTRSVMGRFWNHAAFMVPPRGWPCAQQSRRTMRVPPA